MLRAQGPLPDPHALKFGEQKVPHIACGHDIREEEPDHLAPDHVLSAKTELPVTMPQVDVGLTQHEICAAVPPYRCRIMFVLEIEGAIGLGASTQPPFHPRCQLAAHSELSARAQP